MKEARVQTSIKIVYPDTTMKNLMNIAEFKKAEKSLNEFSHHEVAIAIREMRQEDNEYATWSREW